MYEAHVPYTHKVRDFNFFKRDTQLFILIAQEAES